MESCLAYTPHGDLTGTAVWALLTDSTRLEQAMDDEFLFDDDRLTGRLLTPKEIERLRRHAKKAVAIARESFRQNLLLPPDVNSTR